MGVQVVQGDQSGKEAPLATPAADVWALGVIAYEVLCGTHLQTARQVQVDTLHPLYRHKTPFCKSGLHFVFRQDV